MAWLRRAVAPTKIEVQETIEEAATVHTPENPYCRNLSCWCHTDVEYHDQVTSPLLVIEVDETLFAFAMATLRGS
jgi:hypothetical protein